MNVSYFPRHAAHDDTYTGRHRAPENGYDLSATVRYLSPEQTIVTTSIPASVLIARETQQREQWSA